MSTEICRFLLYDHQQWLNVILERLQACSGREGMSASSCRPCFLADLGPKCSYRQALAVDVCRKHCKVILMERLILGIRLL